MRRAGGLALRGGEPDTRGERGGSGEDPSGLEKFRDGFAACSSWHLPPICFAMLNSLDGFGPRE